MNWTKIYNEVETDGLEQFVNNYKGGSMDNEFHDLLRRYKLAAEDLESFIFREFQYEAEEQVEKQ